MNLLTNIVLYVNVNFRYLLWMQKNTIYTIGELAAEFDITTRTIRHYEEKGLLKPKREGQQRIYSPADRVALKLILRGKRLGFSLDESAELIRMYQPGNKRAQLEALLEQIELRRKKLNQQLNDIKQLQQELDNAEQHCRAALSAFQSV